MSTHRADDKAEEVTGDLEKVLKRCVEDFDGHRDKLTISSWADHWIAPIYTTTLFSLKCKHRDRCPILARELKGVCNPRAFKTSAAAKEDACMQILRVQRDHFEAAEKEDAENHSYQSGFRRAFQSKVRNFKLGCAKKPATDEDFANDTLPSLIGEHCYGELKAGRVFLASLGPGIEISCKHEAECKVQVMAEKALTIEALQGWSIKSSADAQYNLAKKIEHIHEEHLRAHIEEDDTMVE